MKRKIWMALIAMTLTTFFVACDDDDDDTQVTPTLGQNDQNFLNQITQSNLAEIQISSVGRDSATDGSVKQFAQQMINDHTIAQRQVDSIAQAYAHTLPTTADTASVNFRDMLLGMENGLGMDSSYIGQQVRMHNMTLNLLNNASTNAENARVKSFATQQIPIVQAHRDSAAAILSRF